MYQQNENEIELLILKTGQIADKLTLIEMNTSLFKKYKVANKL